MDSLHTGEVRALVELQRRDTALDALKARAAAVPVKLAALEAEFAGTKASMSAAKDALTALQVKKKDFELKIAECDEQMRKQQRDLNLLKDNAAFKAMLTEIEGCKAKKDALETDLLLLLEELDKAAAEDARMKGEIGKVEAVKNAAAAGLAAELKALETELAAGAAARSAAAAAIAPELLEKYEHVRARRGGLAVAEAKEDPASGKFSCGGCHMGLTPQKVIEVKKKDVLPSCQECKRFLFLEKTVFG